MFHGLQMPQCARNPHGSVKVTASGAVYTVKYFCGPIPFHYRDSGTSNLPANIIWPSIVKPVPIIYQQIVSGPVPFSYRDTGTHSITANSFWTGAIFLLGYWYPEFTDKYLLAQYHFTASTPLYISQYHKTETNNAATTSKLLCLFRHLLWCIRENSWECSNLF